MAAEQDHISDIIPAQTVLGELPVLQNGFTQFLQSVCSPDGVFGLKAESDLPQLVADFNRRNGLGSEDFSKVVPWAAAVCLGNTLKQNPKLPSELDQAKLIRALKIAFSNTVKLADTPDGEPLFRGEEKAWPAEVHTDTTLIRNRLMHYGANKFLELPLVTDNETITLLNPDPTRFVPLVVTLVHRVDANDPESAYTATRVLNTGNTTFAKIFGQVINSPKLYDRK